MAKLREEMDVPEVVHRAHVQQWMNEATDEVLLLWKNSQDASEETALSIVTGKHPFLLGA